MEVTAVVRHRGALAHYVVAMKERGTYEAHLLEYNGSKDDEPPSMLRFKKQGQHCSGETTEQKLIDHLCFIVEAKLLPSAGSTNSEESPKTPCVVR